MSAGSKLPWTLAVFILGLVLGALGTIPVSFGAVMHNASTILVVANSMRILFYDMRRPPFLK